MTGDSGYVVLAFIHVDHWLLHVYALPLPIAVLSNVRDVVPMVSKHR